MPAIAVADGSITSPFLALFGRSARATGMENERSNKLGAAQWLHMLNSGHIQDKLEQSPKLRAILASGNSRDKIVEELYLTILSRPPTQEEMRIVEEYVSPASGRGERSRKVAAANVRTAAIDIAWSLINSTEFLHRH